MCVCCFLPHILAKIEKANNWIEMKFRCVFKRHGKEMKLYLPADVCLTVASSAWQFFLCVKVIRFVVRFCHWNAHVAPRPNCFPCHFPRLIAFSVDTFAFWWERARARCKVETRWATLRSQCAPTICHWYLHWFCTNKLPSLLATNLENGCKMIKEYRIFSS